MNLPRSTPLTNVQRRQFIRGLTKAIEAADQVLWQRNMVFEQKVFDGMDYHVRLIGKRPTAKRKRAK